MPGSDPFPYPLGMVVAAFDDDADPDVLVTRLARDGFPADVVDVLHGEHDAARIDETGERHGAAGRLVRVLQRVLSYDADWAHRHAARLRSGEYLVGVDVGEDLDARHRAAQALHGVGGRDVSFFGKDYVESLPRSPGAT